MLEVAIVVNFNFLFDMLKNDRWIKEQAEKGMITPFVPELVRQVEVDLDEVDEAGVFSGRLRNALSFGCSSYGFDIRLSPKDFRVFRHIPGTVINPKRFDSQNLERVALQHDEDGEYFVLPGHSYGLGVSLEFVDIPSNITVICLGKSTYARTGILVNTTPIEAKWRGHVTLEFSNSSCADCRLYANEGICQLLFFEGEQCDTTYHDRNGKYQNQGHEVTLARV
jgi:dCTP deaminase